MTATERALLLLIADYVERKLAGEVGFVSGAKQRREDFEEAVTAVLNEPDVTEWSAESSAPAPGPQAA